MSWRSRLITFVNVTSVRGLVVFFMLLVLNGAGACERSVRWNDNNKPFSWRANDNTVQGLYPDLLREALRRLGCTARFVELPWARAIIELEQGGLDLLPDAFSTKEREQFAYFSRPVRRSSYVLFMNSAALKKFPQKTIEQLANTSFRLGVQAKVSYGARFDALSEKPEFAALLHTYISANGGFQMVATGRLDGLIDDEATGLLSAQGLNLQDQVLPSTIKVTDDLAMIALSKKTVSDDFRQRFNTALDGMLRDGTYTRIMEHHLPCKVSIAKLGCT